MSEKASRPTTSRGGFLPYEMDYIPEDLRKRARSELFEDEETKVHSLKLLKSMLENEPGLHWQNDELLLLAYLRARKFDVKRAFNLMKTTYTVIGKHDELYYDFNFEEVKRTAESNGIGFLPYRDSEGCVIIIINTFFWDPLVNSLGDIMRGLTCALLHAILSPSTQIAGFKAIVDLGGLSLQHVPYISPSYLWLFAEALQNCFPGRFRAVHIVNENYLFSSIWIIIKRFLSKKMKERFHFHGKNVRKLHKYFSPSILPAEYEGELPPFDNTEWRKMLEEKADYLAYFFSHGYQKYKDKAEEKKKPT